MEENMRNDYRIISAFLVLFLFANLLTLKAQKTAALEKWLNSIDGLIYNKTPLDSLHQEAYTIYLPQKLDAEHPEKGSFFQRIYLTHLDTALPVVMVTEGYSASWNYISEPAEILKCNQIIVEHRYFGKSVPDSLNWSLLTTAHAAADHHHIYEIFSQFYKKKWVSTGISKGGQTSIFYKYYYPEDMHISIPYVAPLNLEQEDIRINWFLRHVGTEKDDAIILNYQRLMLQNFDSIFPLFTSMADSAGEQYAINDTLSYEFMVLEFPFSYFQWGSFHLDSIPLKMKSPEQMIKPMEDLGLVSFYYQSTLDGLMPFMVQAYRELGYYNYDLDSLETYMIKLKNSSNIAFVPENLRFSYDNKIMNNIYDFIHNEGNRMIFIYGELDPWSSTSVNPDSRTDAVKLVLAGGSHATRLRHFSPEINEMIKVKLKNWLNDE